MLSKLSIGLMPNSTAIIAGVINELIVNYEPNTFLLDQLR
ncbi:MAG: hypothetical protein ACI82S_001292 [Patiriisocius sp.]|jgi:hypothetical protein